MMLRLQESAGSASPVPSVDDYASDSSTASVVPSCSSSRDADDVRSLQHYFPALTESADDSVMEATDSLPS